MSGPLFRLLLHIETSFCFDVQQQGKGRCMKHGHAPWGLRANDRLEPSPRVADVMQFGRLMAFLVIALCWRSPEHPVVHRHHPLPSAEIGTSIGQFSGDEVHTLHLDVFRVLTLRATWLFVDFGLLDAGRKAKSQILTETLSRIRRMLSAWYHVYENKLGDDKVTRVGTVFNNLTGSDGERVLRLKAAETKHFLPFRHGFASPPQRSASRAGGRIGFARCWRRAVVHVCGEARVTAIVEGWAPHARGLLRHPQLPSIACWNQNETKTSIVLVS